MQFMCSAVYVLLLYICVKSGFKSHFKKQKGSISLVISELLLGPFLKGEDEKEILSLGICSTKLS